MADVAPGSGVKGSNTTRSAKKTKKKKPHRGTATTAENKRLDRGAAEKVTRVAHRLWWEQTVSTTAQPRREIRSACWSLCSTDSREARAVDQQ